ncbi:MAG TPA: hypothetical protein DEQ84_02800 [Prevotellaceae bacterium]|nr:hypothetical protein [Prevotellaceae bacterium]
MEVNVKKVLYSLIDEEYKKQQASSYPANARPILGVPVAALCEMAREYACRKDWQEIVSSLTDKTFEEALLQVLITGYTTQSFETAQKHFSEFLPKIDSDKLCDATCLAFRTAIEYPNETLEWVEKLLHEHDSYKQRFAIVILLDHFVTSDYIDRVLSLYASVSPLSETSMQALAWGYLVCFLGFGTKTIASLASSGHSREQQTYIIDYMLSSPRLSESQRQALHSLKSHI